MGFSRAAVVAPVCVSSLVLGLKPWDSIAWSVAFAAAFFFAGASVICLLQERPDLPSPLHVLFVWFLIFCLIGPLFSLRRMGSPVSGAYEYIPAAIVMEVLGLSIFLAGYTSAVPRLRRVCGPALFSSKVLVAPNLILILLSTGAVTEALSYQGIVPRAYGTQLFECVFLPAWCMLLAAGFMYPRKMTRHLVLASGAVLLVTKYGEVLYSKEAVIKVFGLCPLVAYALSGRRRFREGLLVLGLALLIFVFAFPLVLSSRSGGLGQRDTRLVAVLAHAPSELGKTVEYMQTRLTVLEPLAGVICVSDHGRALRPSNRHWLWSGALIVNVPRLVWPAKPIAPDNGTEIGQQLGLLNAETDANVAITIVGDLFWHYGLLGVILGMFVLGLVTRSLYECFRSAAAKHWLLLLLYLSMLTAFARLEGSVAFVYHGIVRIGIVALIVEYTVRRVRGSEVRFLV